MSSALHDTIGESAGHGLSWRGHARATLALGLPLIGAQLAQIAINVTDTVMIGWLGAFELAAGVLGTQTFFLTFIFLMTAHQSGETNQFLFYPIEASKPLECRR